MSAVTLETLRADYEAARQLWSRHRRAARAALARDDTAAAYDITVSANAASGIAQRAGDLLEVAVKHGLKAAMIFKLSDGNIDPRKPASQ